MLDTEMKVATCKIECGNESGSGALITSNIVLTAGHCVSDALDNNSDISVVFHPDSTPCVVKASIRAHDTNLDIVSTPRSMAEEFPQHPRRHMQRYSERV